MYITKYITHINVDNITENIISVFITITVSAFDVKNNILSYIDIALIPIHKRLIPITIK